MNSNSDVQNIMRLIWMNFPNVKKQAKATSEYIALRRLSRRLRTEKGFYNEINRLWSKRRLSDISEQCAEQKLDRIYIGLRPLLSVIDLHPSTACLEKSMRILQILASQNLLDERITMKIALCRTNGHFEGHAWIQFLEWPLLERPVPDRFFSHVVDVSEILEYINRPRSSSGEYVIHSTVFVKQLAADEAIIIDLRTGVCFGLVGVGYDIWKTIEESGEVASLFSVSQKFPERSNRNSQKLVTDYVGLLCHHGLISRTG